MRDMNSMNFCFQKVSRNPSQAQGRLHRYLRVPSTGLPFEALVSRMEGQTPRYLVEDYPIAYLSSASLLKTLREAQARKTTKARFPLLAFANPVYGRSETLGATRGESDLDGLRARAYLDLMGGTFLELPETEEEARQIKDVLSAPE